MSRIGMEFKGFHARSSEEAKSAPVARNSQVGAEDPWEIGCIAGPEVNSLYPEAAVFHLEKIQSDHYPVKLSPVRRRRNLSLCMKDRVGNWLRGDREIADFIRKGFMDLFTSDHCSAL
nr:hypothetical protein CFP56_49571 [Quercus suber]